MGKRLRQAFIGLGLLGAGIEGAHLASERKDASEKKDISEKKASQPSLNAPDASVQDGGSADAGKDARAQGRMRERMREWESRMKDQLEIEKIRAGAGLDPHAQPILTEGYDESGDSVSPDLRLSENDLAQLHNVFAKFPDLTFANYSKYIRAYVMKDGKRVRPLFGIEETAHGTFRVTADFRKPNGSVPVNRTLVFLIGDWDQLPEVIERIRQEEDQFIEDHGEFIMEENQ